MVCECAQENSSDRSATMVPRSPLINGCRHHRLCPRSHRRHRDTKNGRRHQMSAKKNFCFCET